MLAITVRAFFNENFISISILYSNDKTHALTCGTNSHTAGTFKVKGCYIKIFFKAFSTELIVANVTKLVAGPIIDSISAYFEINKEYSRLLIHILSACVCLSLHCAADTILTCFQDALGITHYLSSDLIQAKATQPFSSILY